MLNNSTAVLLYCCITLLLYHSTAVSLYCCITLLLYHSTAVSLLCCITLMLNNSTAVLLYYCIALLLYPSIVSNRSTYQPCHINRPKYFHELRTKMCLTASVLGVFLPSSSTASVASVTLFLVGTTEKE